MTAAKAPWGEAHAWEANARTYDLAAEIHRSDRTVGGRRRAYALATADDIDTGRDFRAALAAAGFDPARIRREVARVRALAEGRLVREATTWRGCVRTEPGWYGPYPSLDDALTDARTMRRMGKTVRVVRVTRIRKATR